MQHDDETWERIRAELRRGVPPAAYDGWLKDLELGSLTGTHLVLVAPDRTARWVADRFARVLSTSAAAVLGAAVEVDVVARSSAPGSAGGSRSAQPGSELNPGYTFERFVIGQGNRLAHAAALAVAELPGQAYNPLYLCGPPGVGKTHLLHSIAAFVGLHGEGTARCVTADGFTTAFVRAIQSGGIDRFKAHFRNVDILLIDDVQFLEDKARTEEELFHTFNALYESGRQLVFTSDRPPRDITALEERLRERFESGLVAEIEPPDFQTRFTILRRWAHEWRHWNVGRDILEVVASQATGNVRSLQGLLTKVVAHASLHGRPLDRSAVADVLASAVPEPATPSVADVQEVVSRTYGLTVDELVSPSRKERVVWPRQLAMYLARSQAGATLPAIGRSFGGRDHSTVLHACRRAERRIAGERAAREEAERLTALLRTGGRDRGE